ncbi:MAG: DNA methyltransferase [Phormidium sp.]
MQGTTFFSQRLKEKFLKQELNEFNYYLPQHILNIEDKIRSNIFSWRGQFSPQLIENLIFSYCPKNAKILDPFVGSGTVLYESACFGLQAFGCEVNPAAWILSRTYQLINLQSNRREALISSITEKLERYFPKPLLFENSQLQELEIAEFQGYVFNIYTEADYFEKIILDTLIILLDVGNNKLSREYIHNTFYKLCQNIRDFPYSEAKITPLLCDARNLYIETDSIDFVITSPPYINVFNYHQNYRRSAELLGWDLLKIAKSEIGSNRANRRNRFLTVTQYCLDMAFVLQELQRVCKPNTRIIFVVGHESNVLGVPFSNTEIILQLAKKSNMFELSLSQNRIFKNKFGKVIREDLLNFTTSDINLSKNDLDEIAKNIAVQVLNGGLEKVSARNKPALIEAIEKIPETLKSPLYNYSANP